MTTASSDAGGGQARPAAPGFAPERIAAWQAQLEEFHAMLDATPTGLRQVRPAPGSWSLQEIVGHLVDSAANNFQRFARLQLADAIDLPGYDAEDWVRAGHYQAADWDGLAVLWRLLNRQLLHVVSRLPAACLDHVWHKPGAPDPLPLRTIVEDYYRHIGLHRDHFLARQAEVATAAG